MTTITRPFNFSLGSAYSGLASTISYQVVVDGSVVVGPITATGITEGSFGEFTATGSYNVEIANFDTSWVGKITWYESTNEILYEEPFTATQSGDSFPTVGSTNTATSAIKAKTDNLPASPAAVGSAMTLASGSIQTATFAAGATVPAVASVPAVTLADGAIVTATFASGATLPAVATVNDKSGYSLADGSITSSTFASGATIPAVASVSNGVTLASNEHSLIQEDMDIGLTTKLASAVPLRNQDSVTAPTYNDALFGAWCVVFAGQNETDTQFFINNPGGVQAGVARTFALTKNASGQPVSRT